MAGNIEQEKKKPSPIAQAWLLMYNVAMTAGWLALGIGMGLHVWKHRTHKGLYFQMEKQILFFQTCALFEILHAATGIVRTSVILTTAQVFSRVGLLWFVVEPVFQVQNSESVVMFMVAWTITEIIRYSFYSFNLLGSSPYLILWLRYSLFIILYPFGVLGELLTIFRALPYVKESQIYSVALPNAANFSFDYYCVLILIFPLYCIGFPQLYFHMFAQRKKCLGTPVQAVKKDD